MPSPIRPADREHFSIVRESLSLDRLHVAMVGRDRGQLLDYAAALAVTLAEKDGWHVEKYDPDRLETLIVDLMLNRFDAALQTVSSHRALPSRRPPRCVLFIPEAQAIPSATFKQLVRLSAGTRDHRLRLVAIFSGRSQACAERISWMGGQVARWDLDDDAGGASAHALLPDEKARLKAKAKAKAHMPTLADKHYRTTARLLAGATAALVLVVLTAVWPTISGISLELPMNVETPAQDKATTTLAGTLGPESLPISAPPVRDKANDADHHTVFSVNQQTRHDTNSENGSVPKTEVIGQ